MLRRLEQYEAAAGCWCKSVITGSVIKHWTGCRMGERIGLSSPGNAETEETPRRRSECRENILIE